MTEAAAVVVVAVVAAIAVGIAAADLKESAITVEVAAVGAMS